VYEVRDALDAAIRDVETNAGLWHPTALALLQDEYERGPIHLTHGHLPGNRPPRIDSKVGRFIDSTFEPIRHPHAGIVRNQFPESIPVAPIEPLDVEM
jgi:hypothetical protein